MKSVKWLPIAIIAFAAPAIAQHDAFAGEWLQEHLPHESDAGKTKLFVNVDETARTGASARARLLLVDENPVQGVGWKMLDLMFDCGKQTVRLKTQRLYDAKGSYIGEQVGAPVYEPVGEPGYLRHVVFDFACNDKNNSLRPITGDVRNHARGAFPKPVDRDPFEGLFD